MFDSFAFHIRIPIETERTNFDILEAIIITHFAVQENKYRFSITHEIESCDKNHDVIFIYCDKMWFSWTTKEFEIKTKDEENIKEEKEHVF